jgi:hypothetical protein
VSSRNNAARDFSLYSEQSNDSEVFESEASQALGDLSGERSGHAVDADVTFALRSASDLTRNRLWSYWSQPAYRGAEPRAVEEETARFPSMLGIFFVPVMPLKCSFVVIIEQAAKVEGIANAFFESAPLLFIRSRIPLRILRRTLLDTIHRRLLVGLLSRRDQ